MKSFVLGALLCGVLVLPVEAFAGGSDASTRGYFTVEAGAGRVQIANLSRCKRVWAARVYRNIFGTVLWRYVQQQAFCYDGRRITSLYDWRRWPEIYAYGWRFKGHIARFVSGRAGTWHYGTWTQGKFALCAAWCVREKLPWVDLDVYGNGGWSYKTGGS